MVLGFCAVEGIGGIPRRTSSSLEDGLKRIETRGREAGQVSGGSPEGTWTTSRGIWMDDRLRHSLGVFVGHD